MNITKHEQSGFMIETDGGFRLAVDIGAYTPLERLDGIQADAMLVSHIHRDHFSVEHIRKLSPKRLYLGSECIEALGEETLPSEVTEAKAGDSVEIGDSGIKVTFFEVDHGPNVSMKPRENFGFLIEADGKKVYFAGDMFYPSGIDVSALEVDRALLPVGTHYTFGPEEAVAFASQFRRIGNITPMHYQKTPETRVEFVRLAVEKGLNTESFPL